MPKQKTLSGKDIVSIFKSLGFYLVKQRGSHVKLVRQTPNGKQVLGVPMHDEIDKGTQKAIFNQALKYISEEELRKHFYSA